MGLFTPNNNSQTSVSNFLAQTTFNTIIQNNNSCGSSTSVTQNQTVDIGPDPAVLAVCGNLFPTSPQVCANLVDTSNINVTGLTQGATININSSCKFDNVSIQSLQQSIASAVQQKMDTTNDAVGTALTTAVNGFAALSPAVGISDIIGAAKGSNNSRSTTSNVSNFVTSNFTQDNVNTMIQNFVAAQSQVVNIHSAKQVQVSNLTQQLMVTVVLAMLSNNSNTVQALQQVQASTSQSNTEELNQISMMDWIGSLISCIICCIVVSIIIYVFDKMGNKAINKQGGGGGGGGNV